MRGSESPKAVGAPKRAPVTVPLSQLLRELDALESQLRRKIRQIRTHVASLDSGHDPEKAGDLHLLRRVDLPDAVGLEIRQVDRILAKYPHLKRLDQYGKPVVDFAEFQAVRKHRRTRKCPKPDISTRKTAQMSGFMT